MGKLYTLATIIVASLLISTNATAHGGNNHVGHSVICMSDSSDLQVVFPTGDDLIYSRTPFVSYKTVFQGRTSTTKTTSITDAGIAETLPGFFHWVEMTLEIPGPNGGQLKARYQLATGGQRIMKAGALSFTCLERDHH